MLKLIIAIVFMLFMIIIVQIIKKIEDKNVKKSLFVDGMNIPKNIADPNSLIWGATPTHSRKKNRKSTCYKKNHSRSNNPFYTSEPSYNNSTFDNNHFNGPDINPATGFPMMDNGGIDIAGNPYGFDNNSFDNDLYSSPFEDSFENSTFDDGFSNSGFDDSFSNSGFDD